MNKSPNNPNWKHRRRMAYASVLGLLFGLLACFALAVFSPPALGALAQISAFLGTIAVGLAGIVGSYCGFATQETIKKRPTLEEIEGGRDV